MEPRRRRPPFKGYGVPSTAEGMLPWEWAVERLVAARNHWIATTRPNGRPHAMPVWGVWIDEAFFFGSGRSSAKSRNLAANPAIVVPSSAARGRRSSRAAPAGERRGEGDRRGTRGAGGRRRARAARGRGLRAEIRLHAGLCRRG